MKKLKVIIAVSILMLVSVQVKSIPIEYDLTATMYSLESGEVVTQDVVGKMLIDEPAFIDFDDRYHMATFHYNIPLFNITIGEYLYIGDGDIYSKAYERFFAGTEYFVAEWDSFDLHSLDGLFGFSMVNASTTFSYNDGTPYEDYGLKADLLTSDFFNLPYRMDSLAISDVSFSGYSGSMRDVVITQTTSVPEPSIIWLLSSGLILLGFSRRMKA